jgi:lysophospholipase L1-like esterase
LLAVGAAAAAQQSFASSDPVLERSLKIEVDRFMAADQLSPPPPCAVLFVGSSSIVKWTPTLAADMAPLPVINRGFGSSHLEYVNLWFKDIVAPYRPRAIVLYDGENDLHDGQGETVEHVIADFDTFMQLKSAALQDTPVYYISIKPTKARRAEFGKQSAVNAAVRARAAKRSDLHYIDVVAAMMNGGEPKDIFVADGLHMARAGYLLWTPIVRGALLPRAESQLKSCRARWKLP